MRPMQAKRGDTVYVIDDMTVTCASVYRAARLASLTAARDRAAEEVKMLEQEIARERTQ